MAARYNQPRSLRVVLFERHEISRKGLHNLSGDIFDHSNPHLRCRFRGGLELVERAGVMVDQLECVSAVAVRHLGEPAHQAEHLALLVAEVAAVGPFEGLRSIKHEDVSRELEPVALPGRQRYFPPILQNSLPPYESLKVALDDVSPRYIRVRQRLRHLPA